MPIYVYETVPQDKGETIRQFEVRQSMLEPALTHDPVSGIPVRRLILGGLEIPRAPAQPRPRPVCRTHQRVCCPGCGGS